MTLTVTSKIFRGNLLSENQPPLSVHSPKVILPGTYNGKHMTNGFTVLFGKFTYSRQNDILQNITLLLHILKCTGNEYGCHIDILSYIIIQQYIIFDCFFQCYEYKYLLKCYMSLWKDLIHHDLNQLDKMQGRISMTNWTEQRWLLCFSQRGGEIVL